MYVSYAVPTGLNVLFVLSQASASLRPGLFHAVPTGLTQGIFHKNKCSIELETVTVKEIRRLCYFFLF